MSTRSAGIRFQTHCETGQGLSKNKSDTTHEPPGSSLRAERFEAQKFRPPAFSVLAPFRVLGFYRVPEFKRVGLRLGIVGLFCASWIFWHWGDRARILSGAILQEGEASCPAARNCICVPNNPRLKIASIWHSWVHISILDSRKVEAISRLTPKETFASLRTRSKTFIHAFCLFTSHCELFAFGSSELYGGGFRI